MKSPGQDSVGSKASLKRKFQAKKVRASRSANQSMKSPQSSKAPVPEYPQGSQGSDSEDDDLMEGTQEDTNINKPKGTTDGLKASISTGLSLQSPDNIGNQGARISK